MKKKKATPRVTPVQIFDFYDLEPKEVILGIRKADEGDGSKAEILDVVKMTGSRASGAGLKIYVKSRTTPSALPQRYRLNHHQADSPRATVQTTIGDVILAAQQVD